MNNNNDDDILTSDFRKIETLEKIFERLRDKDTGCPWDKVQTHDSCMQCLIEETYEVVDALSLNNPQMMREEFGDLLLQIMFHTQMEREKGNFTIYDVIEDLAKKLVRRHPHVFKHDEKANSVNDVFKIWEKAKTKEAQDNNQVLKHTLDKVPASFPPFLKAYKYGSKTSKLGFDWKNADDAFLKIIEEMEEVKEEAKKDQSVLENKEALKEEVGDLLFAVIQYIRKLELNPDEVLANACKKYKSRFDALEDLAKKNLQEYTLEELEELWQQAKKCTKVVNKNAI